MVGWLGESRCSTAISYECYLGIGWANKKIFKWCLHENKIMRQKCNVCVLALYQGRAKSSPYMSFWLAQWWWTSGSRARGPCSCVAPGNHANILVWFSKACQSTALWSNFWKVQRVEGADMLAKPRWAFSEFLRLSWPKGSPSLG